MRGENMNTFEIWESFEDFCKIFRLMDESLRMLSLADPSKIYEGLALMRESVIAARHEAEAMCRMAKEEAERAFSRGELFIYRKGDEHE